MVMGRDLAKGDNPIMADPTGSGGAIFLEAVLLLGGATIAAPLFKKIGLGTVLGYLAVGLLLGPVLRIVSDGEDVLHVAELGVVLLLFIVGLELKPARLWDMRREIFGLGGSQVLLSGLVLAGFAWLLRFEFSAALVVGFGLALSSTAFAIQFMEDRREFGTVYGKRSFSILLFQDIAIAPLLVAVPILAAGAMEVTSAGLTQAGLAIGSVIGLILIGRYLLNPFFGIIAGTGAREAMIAAALFIVIGAAVLLQYAGLSMALGAFIAGVMLAESSYRHELEADIEPFRGILLGLFFVAVGLAVDLRVVWDNLWLILTIVPVMMGIKALILYGLSRLFGSNHGDAARIAGILPQHGEFGFVLFTAASGAALLNSDDASILTAAVTLSMALTPLSVFLSGLVVGKDEPEHMDEDFANAGSNVLMIGFSRMGQIAAQVLLAGGSGVTVLDNSAERIRQAKNFGFRIYFGDGTRKDVLRAAGIEKAKIVAVCTQHRSTTDEVVELIRHEYPDIQLYVRSYDRGHSLELLVQNNVWQIRETFESALIMGGKLLEATGSDERRAERIIDDVRRRDKDRLNEQLKNGIAAGLEHLHFAPVPEPLEEVNEHGQHNRPGAQPEEADQ
jgi:CPA2 family monovalent cation:H+ antiporter-2